MFLMIAVFKYVESESRVHIFSGIGGDHTRTRGARADTESDFLPYLTARAFNVYGTTGPSGQHHATPVVSVIANQFQETFAYGTADAIYRSHVSGIHLKGDVDRRDDPKLWKRNAGPYPEKEAFVDRGRRLTWSHIKTMSDRLGVNRIDLGLERDDFVYLLLPNWVESYIFRCAAEKAGILVGTSLMTVGEADVGFILKTFDAAGIVIPLEFRKKIKGPPKEPFCIGVVRA